MENNIYMASECAVHRRIDSSRTSLSKNLIIRILSYPSELGKHSLFSRRLESEPYASAMSQDIPKKFLKIKFVGQRCHVKATSDKKAQLTQELRATAPPSSEPEIAPFAPPTPKTLAWNQICRSDAPFARYSPLNYTVTL